MKLTRVRFTVRGMMAGVVVVALLCTIGWPNPHTTLPGALLPALTAGYLAWAGLDGITAVRACGHLMGTRAILFLVALATLLLAAGLTHERWTYLRARAARHASVSRAYEWSATEAERSCEYHVGCFVYHETDPTRLRIVVDRFRQRAGYHSALATKFADAASRPWLPLEPEPPEP